MKTKKTAQRAVGRRKKSSLPRLLPAPKNLIRLSEKSDEFKSDVPEALQKALEFHSKNPNFDSAMIVLLDTTGGNYDITTFPCNLRISEGISLCSVIEANLIAQMNHG